jgi:hypothetical protein
VAIVAVVAIVLLGPSLNLPTWPFLLCETKKLINTYFELLETRLHYEPCLKKVKGNRLTMKRSTIFTGGRLLK